MLSVLILNLLVPAIMLFRDRFCLHRLLRCYLHLLRNVQRPVFWLTFSLLFQKHFVVLFPFSILYFFKIIFVICPFFLTVMVGILANTVLPREKSLVVSGFPDFLPLALYPAFSNFLENFFS